MLPMLLLILLLLLPTHHCSPALSRWSSPVAQSFPFLQHRLGPGDTYFCPLGTLHPLWAVPPQTGSRLARECRGEKAQGSAQGGDQCSPSSSYKDRSGAQEREQREGLA